MFHSFDCVRGHVYPRSRVLAERNGLNASSILLGMLGVVLALLIVAQAITWATAL